MPDLDRTRNDPTGQLWDELDRVPAGMLGIEDSPKHLQPMNPKLDRPEGKIWFFARKDSELVAAVGLGARAQFSLVGRDHDYYATLSGTLREEPRDDKIDAFWSPAVAAWYPEGRTDRQLTLLEFAVQDASIWASTDSTLAFGWEMAKAAVTPREPDVGVRQQVSF